MRVGFVLAELFTGSSLSLWPAVASMFPSDGKDCLVVFPGGRLKSAAPLEKMKNSIYRLVNSENLDGSIIWCSTLTGDALPEDVLGNFESMLSRPMVTIERKTASYPEIPDVRFNAYEGFRSLVIHCIEEHGCRRIAYLRGPENHRSAQDRYRAYMDALEEKGVPFDPSIVSDPAPWSRGAESMRQILDERGKLPNRDFDMLVCASDLILYTAAQELASRGYEIGRDVKACGFNDSIESRLFNIPATTVRMPSAELGITAVDSLRKVEEGKPCPDIDLPAVPVIRRSCGCSEEKKWERISSPVAFADEISGNFSIPRNDARVAVESLVQAPGEQNVLKFLELLCVHDVDLFDMMSVIEGFKGLSEPNEKQRQQIINLSKTLLPSVMDRQMSVRNYQDRTRRSVFNLFNNELLEANKIVEISDILARNASSLGFEKILLVVSDGEKSNLVGTNLYFPENLILPSDVCSEILGRGAWIASPLCTETENMGYLLMKPKEFNGSVCEQIRSAVSSALRSSILFESTIRAQQTAEEAEQARTNFFANVGENLRDPLAEIMDLVSGSDIDAQTRKAILDRITGANQILDLALSSTNELELNRYTVSLDSFLSEFPGYRKSMSLPCLLIDENRLRQALQIIVSSMKKGSSITAEMQVKGVRITVSDKGGRWKPDSSEAGFSLARKIVLMHNGTCSVSEKGFSMLLPYPTLSGNAPLPWEEGNVLACINRIPDSWPQGAVCEEVGGSRFAEKKRLPAFTGAVSWDPAFKGYNALTSLIALISNSTYRDLPFICTDLPRSKTLEDAARLCVEARGRVVLQVGNAPEELKHWLQDPEYISCDMASAARMARSHEPDLIIISPEGNADPGAAVVSFLDSLRALKRISQTPVIICTDFLDGKLVGAVSDIPNVIAVNTCIFESEEFAMRIRAVMGGSQILATNTGAIVKKAQAYICSHATLSLNRWQVAESVHVSEDYLTRIFKKELGLSPWDYLNRYRVWLACRLLRNTGSSVNEVAIATGFQDQAYFCRVFKKIKGFSPSRMRSTRKSEMYKNR